MPWEPVWLYPIGDSQIGAQGSRPDKLRKHTRSALLKGNPRFVGVGDPIDLVSPSNREMLASMPLYDSPLDAIEAAGAMASNKFLAAVKGTEGKWAACVEGHHYISYRDGLTSDQKIATALGAQFMGTSGMLHLRFKRHKGVSSIVCRVWLHHGEGSGAMLSAPMNKLERFMDGVDADIYIIGHYTRQIMAPKPRLFTSNDTPPKWKSRTRWMICAGGWYEGYQAGSMWGNRPRGTYVERKMLSPVTMGAPYIKITPHHGNSGDTYTIKPEYCDCGGCS